MDLSMARASRLRVHESRPNRSDLLQQAPMAGKLDLAAGVALAVCAVLTIHRLRLHGWFGVQT